MTYDALLVLSFGGPERREDVIPFLENVLRGRNVPRERMLEVAEHYYHFDGVSPINEQCRALIRALEQELESHGPRLPIYWGNRNWHPLLTDTLSQMQQDGVKKALAFVTSAFSSYSGCRQYLEDIERARQALGDGAPVVDKLRGFWNHPGFLEPLVENVRASLEQVPADRRNSTRIAFTAHSIPMTMSATCDYLVQLQEASKIIADRFPEISWRLVFQSRSGPPNQPWLEPDIGDYLRELHEEGACTDLVVLPIGFISDHLEVLYDLDTEAQAIAQNLGITMHRAATVGVHPTFISMIRELILERTEGAPKRAIGSQGPRADFCHFDCCRPNESSRPVHRPQ